MAEQPKPAQPRTDAAASAPKPAPSEQSKAAKTQRPGLTPEQEALAQMESPEAQELRIARNEPPRATVSEPHPGDPVRDIGRNVSPTLPESNAGLAVAPEGTTTVKPFKTFEWKGKLVGPSADEAPLSVTNQEAAELRANGLVLSEGEEQPAVGPDQVMMQSNPRIAVVERRDGRVDPPDDKESGRAAKLGLKE